MKANCVVCGKEFETRKPEKSCSDKCKKERTSQRVKAWKRANRHKIKCDPEKSKAARLRWAERHPEKAKERARRHSHRHYLRNKAKYHEKAAAHRLANLDAYNKQRRESRWHSRAAKFLGMTRLEYSLIKALDHLAQTQEPTHDDARHDA